jgi:hypothetical protein
MDAFIEWLEAKQLAGVFYAVITILILICLVLLWFSFEI